MSEFSEYYENKIGDHMLRNQSFTVPTTIYVALFTAVTGLESDAPTLEVSGGSYARQTCTLSAFSGGASSNNANIEFPQATGDWGIVSHAALVDHVSNVTWGTNVHVLMWSALDASKTISTGDIFRINSGDLAVTIA
jgi:hypothetical protein